MYCRETSRFSRRYMFLLNHVKQFTGRSQKAKLVVSFNLIHMILDIEPQKGRRHKNYVRRPVKNFLKHSFCATPLPLFFGDREKVFSNFQKIPLKFFGAKKFPSTPKNGVGGWHKNYVLKSFLRDVGHSFCADDLFEVQYPGLK